MTNLSNLIRELNRILKPRAFDDISINGLQFRGKDQIKRICGAVDATLEVFNKASNCDLLIVHHGIKWRGMKELSIKKRRMEILKKLNLSLYAAHIPLDYHETFGNNILIAKQLELNELKRFYKYGKIKLGFKGSLKGITTDKLLIHIKKKLNINPRVINRRRGNIDSIGIVSGSGDDVYRAYKEGVDCLITGDVKYGRHIYAKELNIGLIVLGHYNSERYGVYELSKYIANKYNLNFSFIDIPSYL